MKSHITTGLLICLLITWMSPATILAQSQTYIVSTTDDVVDANDNLLSLREAIASANANTDDGDIIQFSSTLSGQTISLTLGELVIEDDVVIGNDTAPVPITIDAAGASRIFSVSTSLATGSRVVSILDIAFLNGFAANGGALFIGEGEDVQCKRCIFENNAATGDTPGQGGGGIYTEGMLTITDSDFLNNTAITGAGNGGGILVAPTGTLSISASTFEANIANRAGGAVEINQGAAKFEEVFFSKNNAGQNTASAAPGNGGAIHISGMGTATINGGQALGNIALSEGGAFWNGSGTMTIDGTTIGGIDAGESNIASGDNADNGGGGLFNNGGTMIVDNVDMLWNIADGAAGSGGGVLSDGGLLQVSNTVLQGNSSMRAGGGIETTNGAELILLNVDFLENAASSAPGNGGAVHVTGPGNSTITGGKVLGNVAASEGGGFWNGSGIMKIENTQIGGPELSDGNTASGANSDNGGGGIFNNGGTMMILNAWIEGNVADGASGSGGGVLNDGGSVRMERTMVRGNRANRAGGGIESNGLPDANGRIQTTTDFMQFVTLMDNVVGTAPGNGGGFHQTGPGNVSFVQSLAAGNKAGNEGGGLWNSGIGSMRLLNATVSGNEAPEGGGVFQQAGGSSSLRFWLSTIVRNTATTSGGGIQSDGGLPVFFNTILAENLTNQAVSNCFGTFSSIGRNLFESLDGCSLAPEPDDIVGQSPLLFDLADNGGPTLTHALMDGSPAIDTGMCIPSIMEDQRGTRRVFPCDMGSFETDGRPTVDSGITFTLIDATTDSPISGFDPIANGMNIVQSDLPDAVNVRANVAGNPGSVVFDFNGTSTVRLENFAPYALFGDLDGDFLPGVLYEGTQSITARPFSLTDGEGQPMTSQNITFSVVGSRNVITRLVLVDADTDQDVMVLENDITISIDDLPTNLNVRAEAGSATRSVSFAVGEESRTEVVRPYALFGDVSGDYLNGSVPPGMYELVVTPYDAAGREGVNMVLRATVTDGSNSNGNKAEFATLPLPANEAVILSDESADIPAEFSLHKNYPNPFNPTTVIGYSVPQASHVELVVFNLLGQRVQTLISGTVQAGSHQVSMDATDLPSGIYLYRLITPTGTQTRKMILAK